ncbi:unnamed protein product [Cuscuta europaea]|uniref:Uncharacterized protein n=1 Tax=Cuscuta europaea TaxID=41803 RepID=A0A9P0ZJ42_CUSEU|nr:unnamed protein product [Cuscuta europaea]
MSTQVGDRRRRRTIINAEPVVEVGMFCVNILSSFLPCDNYKPGDKGALWVLRPPIFWPKNVRIQFLIALHRILYCNMHIFQKEAWIMNTTFPQNRTEMIKNDKVLVNLLLHNITLPSDPNEKTLMVRDVLKKMNIRLLSSLHFYRNAQEHLYPVKVDERDTNTVSNSHWVHDYVSKNIDLFTPAVRGFNTLNKFQSGGFLKVFFEEFCPWLDEAPCTKSKASDTKAKAEAPDTKAEAPDTKAKAEAPETKAKAEAPDTKAKAEAPDTKAKAPDTKAKAEASDSKAKAEASDSKAKAEASDTKEKKTEAKKEEQEKKSLKEDTHCLRQTDSYSLDLSL